jgi:RNA polymerase subunit RPABC4/transcription elongation factor Spt4
MECHCKRCGYVWNSHVKAPKCCPNCKSPYWNKDRGAVTVIKPPEKDVIMVNSSLPFKIRPKQEALITDLQILGRAKNRAEAIQLIWDNGAEFTNDEGAG